MKALNENEIVELFLRRDEKAIACTAEKYGHRLRRLAFGIVEDELVAEECENDTYLQAWNAIPPHEPRGYLYAFLARITRHVSLNRCREKKRGVMLCELSEELEMCVSAADNASEGVDAQELGEKINQFLAGLNREKRAIFLRRYWYFESVEEISARLGISKAKVKTTLFRCREQLKVALEKEGYTI